MGASDSTYRVGIEFDVADLSSKLSGITSRLGGDMFKPATAGLKSELGGIGDAVMKIGGNLSEAFTGAVEKAAEIGMTLGKIGLTAAVGAAAYGVAGLNNELEQTNLSLAAIFNAQGFSANFADAMGLAADQVAKMKVDVKSLPGDLGQLAAIMKTIATPAAQGGADPDKIRSLAGRSMLVGQILGVQQDMVAREMAMLLSGRAGAHNVLGTRLGLTGDAAKKFNGESASDRVKDIGSAFDKYGPAAEAFGKSWVANFTTLKDNIKYGLLAPVTSPLFDSVKKTIGDINGWFDHNQAAVSRFTGKLGESLRDAFEWGRHAIEDWWPSIEKFGHDAFAQLKSVWDDLRPVISEVGSHIQKALANGEALDKIKGILELYAALKVGGAVAPFAGMIGKGLGGAGGIGAVFEGGSAAALALPALAGAAAIATGEMIALTDSSSKYHADAVKNASDLASAWGGIVSDFTTGHSVLSDFFAWFGTEGTRELAAFGQGLRDVLSNKDFNGNKQSWRDAANYFNPTADFQDQNNQDKFNRSTAKDTYSPNRDDAALDFSHSATNALDQRVAAALKPKLPSNMSVTTNNYVTMTISGSEEPSRIARVVTQRLAEMSRFPTSSRYAGTNYVSGRRT